MALATDQYDPFLDAFEIIQYRLGGVDSSSLFVTIPYKAYKIQIRLGANALADHRLHNDEVKIYDFSDKDITEEVVNVLPEARIRPYGANIYYMFILIDRYIDDIKGSTG